jgi:hypothetical protein
MFKVGDMVAINVFHPSKWGIVVEVTRTFEARKGCGQKVRVQWGWKSQWHNSYNLKVVSEAS